MPMADGAPQRMTDSEKFFFDLDGYFVVRGALSAEEVKKANEAIDAHTAEIKERTDQELRNTKSGSCLAGDGKSGRRDLAGMLGWPQPHCQIFRKLLAHPKLRPYIIELCGLGYRLDHLPVAMLQHRGSEGFALHGGPLTGDGGLNPTLQYRCFNRQFYNSLLAMSVVLTDHRAGDGGFCVVRGSHKMNFSPPPGFKDGEAAQDHLFQPVTKAGDVIFFSEATMHGALPWNAEHERRIVLYRFAPATVAYGRTYSPQWPAEYLEGMSDVELAVMEPPYAERLDRPVLRHDSTEPEIRSRSKRKKEFDKEVFGTKYF